MNKLIIIGNLTADPELRATKDGIEVCTFTVAVNRKPHGADARPEADFFRITAWRKLAPICKNYLAKGRKVMVTGPVSISSYTNKDGKIYSNLEVTADDIEFLTPRNEQPPVEDTLPPVKAEPKFVQVEEELPF